LEDVKNVVNYADEETRLTAAGFNGGIRKCFTKTANGRKLVVIGELKKNDCWLATAYYED
jgi:hypothetical protein